MIAAFDTTDEFYSLSSALAVKAPSGWLLLSPETVSSKPYGFLNSDNIGSSFVPFTSTSHCDKAYPYERAADPATNYQIQPAS
jgi:hypothetical protein